MSYVTPEEQEEENGSNYSDEVVGSTYTDDDEDGDADTDAVAEEEEEKESDDGAGSDRTKLT